MNFEKMTRYLDSILDLGVPGVDCIIMHGYDTVYRHQAGYSDREAKIPMNGREAFFIYSNTKVLTCTAIMQLVEAGIIVLNDPISKYLPEFKDMQVLLHSGNGEVCLTPARGTLSPAHTPITFRHLMSMTAGLDYNLTSPAILEVQQKTNGRAPTREVVRALASQPLHFNPGTHWHYSLCHDVLGALIEVISGQSLGQYFQEHILDPLEMTHTGFRHGHDLPDNMMAQYCWDYKTNTVSRIPLENEYILGSEYESGGAGLVSTVEDYAKFVQALANGGRSPRGQQILSPASIELMRTNQLTGDQWGDFNWPWFAGYGYGLGVRTMMDRAKGGALSPVGEFGWGGAAGTYALIDPENHISMFYAQHMRESLEWDIHPRLRNVLYGCL